MKFMHPHDALRVILDTVRPLPIKRVPLDGATGYCLAQDIRADRDQPPTDRSAMDGYALRAQDLSAAELTLSLAGESSAGRPCPSRVFPGTCVRILTGGVVPRGADAVMMLEHAREHEGQVHFDEMVPLGVNIRRRGEDARKGAVVLAAGSLLRSAQIGLSAAVGKALVSVRAKPRVAVLSTGRELRTVAQRVESHQIRDANGPALCAALESAGFPPAFRAIVDDDPRQLAKAIRSALDECDVLMVTGGVSVGRYDFVPEAIRSLRGRIRIHGVAMKPGKPMLYATLGLRQVFGLPGNPVSALVGLHQFAIPALRRVAGWRLEWCRPMFAVALADEVQVRGQRVEFLLASLTATSAGWVARTIRSAGSADLVAACGADGVIEIDPRRRGFRAGQIVPFIPWRPIW
jgi:molybdopterin molybdotransferase